MPKRLSISCAPEQERACRKVPGESGKSPAPCHHFSFSPSCHKGLVGCGEGCRGARVNKETLSQIWSLLLDALVPHKADGGLQSSPQQAPGQDHQGFFLSDNHSGEQSQPPPVSALP